jgi:hypothetical protein
MTAFDGAPDRLTETVGFDFDAIDGDQQLSPDDEFWELLGEILGAILEWQTEPGNPRRIGQRTMVLALWLRPGLLKEQSLLQISKADPKGCTRAALSHALLSFQEKYSAGRANFQKLGYMRERFRRSRIASHQSQVQA